MNEPGVRGALRVTAVAVMLAVFVAEAAAGGTAFSSPSSAAALNGAATRLGFDSADLPALVEGKAAARQLETANDSELCAMGVIVVPAPLDQVATGFRDLSVFKQSGMTEAAGRFSDELSLADLEDLQIPDADLKSLARARTLDSDIKLSDSEIGALRAGGQANPEVAFKQFLLKRVAAFRKDGLAGLGNYADKRRRIEQIEVTKPLLDSLNANRPTTTLELADSFQYWSVERFDDFKPLIEVTHVSLYRGPGIARVETVQLYASHYCEALVTGVDLISLPSDTGELTLMRLTFRTQVDVLGGILGGLKRKMGRAKTVDQVAGGLARFRSVFTGSRT